MNSSRIAAVVACAVGAAPVVGQNALVLDGSAIDNIGEAGAVGAGLAPTVVTTAASFQGELAGGPWQVAVIDVTSTPSDLDTIASDLQDYLDSGGKILMNYWNLDANPMLQSVMDVASETDILAPRGYFRTNVAHPSWGLISGIGPGSDLWGEHGGVMTPAAGGVVYGEFDATGSGDGALIIGNGGRTIMNGHDWDSLDTSGSRRQNLARNQIRYMSQRGACAWQDFSWSAPGDIVGPFTLKVTRDRPVLKVTDAFIDGDRFEVRINGTPVFTTSNPTDLGLNTSKIDEAYASGVSDMPGPGGGRWSAGAVRLAPGTYNLTIRVLATATGFPSGGARYQLCNDPVPQVSGGLCTIDYHGDPDGFGTLSAPVNHDFALWAVQFGGSFFTDYRESDDTSMWPVTDIWDNPAEISWTHNYTVPSGLSSARLRLYTAGNADSSGASTRVMDLLVDGALLTSFEFPNAGEHTHVLDVDVPLARIDGSTRFTLRATGAVDGYIVDYAALEMCGGACYADCDGSGSLDFFDFLCFQNEFAASDPYADCDGSGSLDFFDFLCFQNEFAAGCP